MKVSLFVFISICSSFSAFAGDGDYCSAAAVEGAKALATVNGAAIEDLKAPRIKVNNPDQPVSYEVSFGKRVYSVDTIALEGICRVVAVTDIGEEI